MRYNKFMMEADGHKELCINCCTSCNMNNTFHLEKVPQEDLVSFTDIQAIVHGEGFLIFRKLRIQKPSLVSERHTLI